MKNKFTPIKMIRRKCLECSGRPKDVRLCQNINCPLYQYRFGTNPQRAGIGGKSSKIGCFDSKKAILVDNIESNPKEAI